MRRYIDADKLLDQVQTESGCIDFSMTATDIRKMIIEQPTADVRDYATAHKVVGGGEHDGATCWFECDNCGLAVDIGDVFCKHCGARFVP